MYIIIVLAALVCAAVLAVQTIRREQPQNRMRVAAIGGGTSMAMILGAYILFILAELPLFFYRTYCVAWTTSPMGSHVFRPAI